MSAPIRLLTAALLCLPVLAGPLTILPRNPSVIAGGRVTLRAEQDGKPARVIWMPLDPEAGAQLGEQATFAPTKPGRYLLRAMNTGTPGLAPTPVAIEVLAPLPFYDIVMGGRLQPGPPLLPLTVEHAETLPSRTIPARIGEPVRVAWEPAEGERVLSYMDRGEVVRRRVTGLEHLTLHLDVPPRLCLLETLTGEPGNLRSTLQALVVETQGVTVFSGSLVESGSRNGHADFARFCRPSAMAWWQNRLVVADRLDHTLRMLDVAGSVLATWGQSGAAGCQGDGQQAGDAWRFNGPAALAADPRTGTLYVADAGNHVIRALDAQGRLRTYAGQAGTPGGEDGARPTFDTPCSLAVGPDGALYVVDGGAQPRLRVIHPDGRVETRLRGLHGPEPSVACQGSSGRIYLLDGGDVKRVDATRTVSLGWIKATGKLAFRDRTYGAPAFSEKFQCGSLAALDGGLLVARDGILHLVRLDAQGEALNLIRLAGEWSGRDPGETGPCAEEGGRYPARLGDCRAILPGPGAASFLVAASPALLQVRLEPQLWAAALKGHRAEVSLTVAAPDPLQAGQNAHVSLTLHANQPDLMGRIQWAIQAPDGEVQRSERAVRANGTVKAAFHPAEAGTYAVEARLTADGRTRFVRAALEVQEPAGVRPIRIMPRTAACLDSLPLRFTAQLADGKPAGACTWTLRSGPGTLDAETGVFTPERTGRVEPVEILAETNARAKHRSRARFAFVVMPHKFGGIDGEGHLRNNDLFGKVLGTDWLELAQPARDRSAIQSSYNRGARRAGVGVPFDIPLRHEPNLEVRLRQSTAHGTRETDVTGRESARITVWNAKDVVKLEFLRPSGGGLVRTTEHLNFDLNGVWAWTPVRHWLPTQDVPGLRAPGALCEWPYGNGFVAVDGHALYHSDDHGTIYHLAGDRDHAGHRDQASNREGVHGLLNHPTALALKGNDHVWVCDAGNRVIRILQVWKKSLVTIPAHFQDPQGIASWEGDTCLVADRGAGVLQILDAAGRCSDHAGLRGHRGAQDGPRGQGSFTRLGALAVVQPEAGPPYAVVVDGHAVRSVDAHGTVRTLVGSPGQAGYADGTQLAGRPCLNGPTALAVQSETLLILDAGNHCLRAFDLRTGRLATLAGDPQQPVQRYGLLRDGGPALDLHATFGEVHGLCLEKYPRLWLSTGDGLVQAARAIDTFERQAQHRISLVREDGAGPVRAGQEVVLRPRLWSRTAGGPFEVAEPAAWTNQFGSTYRCALVLTGPDGRRLPVPDLGADGTFRLTIPGPGRHVASVVLVTHEGQSFHADLVLEEARGTKRSRENAVEPLDAEMPQAK